MASPSSLSSSSPAASTVAAASAAKSDTIDVIVGQAHNHERKDHSRELIAANEASLARLKATAATAVAATATATPTVGPSPVTSYAINASINQLVHLRQGGDSHQCSAIAT